MKKTGGGGREKKELNEGKGGTEEGDTRKKRRGKGALPGVSGTSLRHAPALPHSQARDPSTTPLIRS